MDLEMAGKIHWGWHVGYDWDGNWEAMEPRELQRPACGVKTNDYPHMVNEDEKITCKRCLARVKKESGETKK
jgi:hypothetical protein